MQNENIAACKSATWNSAIHKKSATRKKSNMKKYNLPQRNTEKVHKNSALQCTNEYVVVAWKIEQPILVTTLRYDNSISIM